MIIPEFSRPLTIDRLGEDGLAIEVEADATERAALARRLAIPAIHRLRCVWRLGPIGGDGAIAADGLLEAVVVRTCVLTLDDFEAPVTDAFSLRFVPAGLESTAIELEEPDEISFEGDTIDLGEAAAEQLALALDPYPRRPGAELPATIDPEAEPGGPFAGLRGRMGPH